MMQHQFIAWTLPPRNIFMMLARFGIISANCIVILQRSEANILHAVECLQHAETKTIHHLHSMCSILEQNLAQRMVLAICCNSLSLASCMAFAAY